MTTTANGPVARVKTMTRKCLDDRWSKEMRAAMSNGRACTQQSVNKMPRSRRFGLIGWMVAALLLCLTSTAWSAAMVTNGGFDTISGWTLGGTGASYSTLQNHATLPGAGSILQYSGSRNTTTTGTEAQSVSVAAGSVIQNKADVSLWAMHAWTGGSSTTQTVTITLRYADATTVQIFTGTVTPGSSWTSITNATLTAFPLTLTQNVNQITVTTVTRGGSVNPSTSSLYVDDIAIVYTPAATDSLTVTSNTAVATTAMPGATDIQMSFLQLNSDATGNGNCVLTSATVDDVNIAATGTIANLKVHVDNDTNFVNGVLGTATVATWNGQSTVVDLTGIAVASRTVTTGTPKYLWVTYDIDAAAVNGTTVQSSVTAIGVLAPDIGPLGGPWDSNSLLITVGLGCGECHPNPMVDGVSRDPATGGVVGNHTKHASAQGYDCILCHLATPATPRHRDTYIAIVDPIQGVTNARYTTTGKTGVVTGAGFVKFTQVTTPVRGNCQNTYCHGGNNVAGTLGGPAGTGPQWGTTSADTCTFCHNSNKTNSGGTANAYPTAASPFRSTAAAGAHAVHLTATTNLMNGGVQCADCHATYATVTAAGHVDDATIAAPADMTWGAEAQLNSTTPDYAAGSCTVYCHGVKTPGLDPGATDSTPAWTANWTTYVPGTAGTCSNMCHGLPPTDGTHSGKAFPASCKSCHGSTVTTTTDPPAIVASFHINGTVEATGCTGCHGTDPKQYPPVSYWGTNKSTADGVGAHVAHLEATATYMSKEAIAPESTTTGYWCAECHTTTRGDTGHDDAAYPANIAFTNAVESKYNTHTPTITFEADNNPDLGNGATCSVYCHGAKMPKGDTSGTTRTPAWGVTLTGCNVCHGAPPTAGTSAGTHSGQAFPGSCKTCHPSTVLDTLNPPTLDPAFHINGTVEASGCNGCHGGDNNTNGWSNKNMWPYAGAAYPKRVGEHEVHITRLITKLGTTVAAVIADDTLQKSLCTYCHGAAATIGAAGHNADNAPTGQVDVGSFLRIWSAAADAGTAGTYTSPNCFTVDCHNEIATNSNGTFGWFANPGIQGSQCIMCHTPGTANNPNSGLHTGTAPTVSGQKHDSTLTGGCAACHTIAAYAAAGSHINGTFSGNSTLAADRTALGLTFSTTNGYTQTADNVGSCVGTWLSGCHTGAGDVGTWARKWNSTINNDPTGDGDVVECGGCHGGFDETWTFGNGTTNITDGSVEHNKSWDGDATTGEVIGFHTGTTSATACVSCHAYGDASYVMGTRHRNGTIEMNSSVGYAQAAWNCTGSCHAVNTNHNLEDSGWTVAALAGPAPTCTGCHNGSGTNNQFEVSSASSHTDPDGTGATYAAGAGNCEICHFASHGTETTNTIAVTWDTRTMGTSYVTGDGKIHLKNNIGGTNKTYEAEICWGCHWDIDVPSLPAAIKEFGNTQGVYTTGTLNQRNWFGATWTSANFAYKTGTINSFHQAVADLDTAITIDTAHVAADVGTIGCTSCHDVHRIGMNGFTPAAGGPYLRGSWTSNPFKEDGAPVTGQTGWTAGDARGDVPRAAALLGVTGNNEYGGWQIEQNNASFTNTDYGTNATTSYAGLCSKCHTQAALEGMTWKGHDNAVSGFSAGSETNIFWQGSRMNWASAKKGTWEYGYIVNAGTTDARGQAISKTGYIGAIRNANQWNDGIDPAAGKPQYSPLKQPSFTTGPVTTLDVTGTTAQANFHNFPCSKCHSPHASRLPRLSITNCLDVKHNSWDDGATFDPSSWSATTANIAGDLAYGSTAGNCHRYVPTGDANAEDGAEAGWNSVTPW